MGYNISKNLNKYGEQGVLVWLKNGIYLSYILLLPIIVPLFIFSGEFLTILGVKSDLISFYVPYFRYCLITIGVCPFRALIPEYYKGIFKNKISSMLNIFISITMPVLAFIALWFLGLGVNGMLLGCLFANLIPLIYFIFKGPREFFSKGFEIDINKIKFLWIDAKWELMRRLAPRISAVYVSYLLMILNPHLMMIKYIVMTLGSFLEGYVDSAASLSNMNTSYNSGLGLKDNKAYKDNQYIWRVSLLSLITTIVLIVFTINYWSFLLTSDNIVKIWLSNYIIWVFLCLEIIGRLRYYILISTTRTIYKKLNGVTQSIYAITAFILTPLLMYLFLMILHFSILGVFISGAIVGLTQFILTEFYLRKNDIVIGF